MEVKRAHSANTTSTDQKEGPQENSGTQTQVSGMLLQRAQYQVSIEKSTVYSDCWGLFKSLETAVSCYLTISTHYQILVITHFLKFYLGAIPVLLKKTLYNSPFLPQNNEMLTVNGL